MNAEKSALVQVPLAAVLEELDERFEAWCAERGVDPGAVGAWEQFDRECD